MTFYYVPPPSYRPGQEAKLPVLQFFRMGIDTSRIAELKKMDESRIYNFLHQAREKERSQIERLRAIK